MSATPRTSGASAGPSTTGQRAGRNSSTVRKEISFLFSSFLFSPYCYSCLGKKVLCRAVSIPHQSATSAKITMTLLWVPLAPLSPYIPLIWKQFRSEQSSKTEVSPWLLESNIRHLYAYIGCLKLKEEDGGDRRRRRQLIDQVAGKKCGLTTLS